MEKENCFCEFWTRFVSCSQQTVSVVSRIATNPSNQLATVEATSLAANLIYEGPDDPFPSSGAGGEIGKNIRKILQKTRKNITPLLKKNSGKIDNIVTTTKEVIKRQNSVGEKGVVWIYGAFKTETKWANQLAKRGWTPELITEAITKGKSFIAKNMLNKANLATRFIHPTTGQSVVIDNVTKELIHVGGVGFKY